jgi:hypothetical protein
LSSSLLNADLCPSTSAGDAPAAETREERTGRPSVAPRRAVCVRRDQGAHRAARAVAAEAASVSIAPGGALGIEGDAEVHLARLTLRAGGGVGVAPRLTMVFGVADVAIGAIWLPASVSVAPGGAAPRGAKATPRRAGGPGLEYVRCGVEVSGDIVANATNLTR